MSDQPTTPPPQQAIELVSDLSLVQRLDNALDEIHSIICDAVLLNPLATAIGQKALDEAIELFYSHLISHEKETALRDMITMFSDDDDEAQDSED